MFVLGVSLRNKEDQQAVYPRIGPIFGYFELGVLIILIATGLWLIFQNDMIYALFDFDIQNVALDALREKLLLVFIMTIITVIHLRIAFRTNGKERSKWEKILSRGSSLGIFVLNFVVLHYAIVLRDVL